MVAVTKYVGPNEVRALVKAGCRELGESRPQELWRKAQNLTDVDVHWHQVGHVQRNKLRRTLPLVSLFHSVDSQRLLLAIEQEAAELERRFPILLEVNISGEEAKHGFSPAQVEQAVGQAAELPHVELRGLMTMASLTGGRERARANFAQLRTLRDQLAARLPPGVSLRELSMGMSGDYDLAILEGATIVRVGSALFEGVVG
jgi:pyridoxal phosphate enzyme (YggS family)